MQQAVIPPPLITMNERHVGRSHRHYRYHSRRQHPAHLGAWMTPPGLYQDGPQSTALGLRETRVGVPTLMLTSRTLRDIAASLAARRAAHPHRRRRCHPRHHLCLHHLEPSKLVSSMNASDAHLSREAGRQMGLSRMLDCSYTHSTGGKTRSPTSAGLR